RAPRYHHDAGTGRNLSFRTLNISKVERLGCTMEQNEATPSPLERRGRYPREGERAPSKRLPAPPSDPLVPRPENIDPASPGRAGEIPESDWEGQEGVGPGPRDAVRKAEKGEPTPEEPPEDLPGEGASP